MNRLELSDHRGQYVHPTAEQVLAAGLDDNGKRLFAAVEQANSEVEAASAAVAEAKFDVLEKLGAVADAKIRLHDVRPKISGTAAARAFIRTGQQEH